MILIHYSRFSLNTYCASPYFQAHLPEDYLLEVVLTSSRAFRRLPSNLKELSRLARQWTVANGGDIHDIKKWYDAEGYELNFATGKRLTDEEIDAVWDKVESDFGKPSGEVEDIPIPRGGFPDPEEWREPAHVEPPVTPAAGPSREQLLSDIASRGRQATAEEYGMLVADLPSAPAIAGK